VMPSSAALLPARALAHCSQAWAARVVPERIALAAALLVERELRRPAADSRSLAARLAAPALPGKQVAAADKQAAHRMLDTPAAAAANSLVGDNLAAGTPAAAGMAAAAGTLAAEDKLVAPRRDRRPARQAEADTHSAAADHTEPGRRQDREPAVAQA
jgi:hypothetical protein